MGRLILGCLLFLGVPALAGSPQEEERAKELFDNGANLFAEGEYEAALMAWEESYRLSKQPLLLYNMASAHERLGHLDEAISDLNTYRAFAPADEREALERRIRALERRMADEADDSSETNDPTGVDDPDQTSGSDETDDPDATEGTDTEGTDDGDGEVTDTPDGAGPDGDASVDGEGEIDAPPAAPKLAPPLIAYGVGVAGLGVGAGFGLHALSVRGQLDEACTDGLCPADAESLLTRDRTAAALSDVGFAVGAVGMAVGTVLLATQLTAVEVGPGHLRLHGRF